MYLLSIRGEDVNRVNIVIDVGGTHGVLQVALTGTCSTSERSSLAIGISRTSLSASLEAVDVQAAKVETVKVIAAGQNQSATARCESAVVISRAGKIDGAGLPWLLALIGNGGLLGNDSDANRVGLRYGSGEGFLHIAAVSDVAGSDTQRGGSAGLHAFADGGSLGTDQVSAVVISSAGNLELDSFDVGHAPTVCRAGRVGRAHGGGTECKSSKSKKLRGHCCECWC